MHPDIVVVGGGPIGLTTARIASERGASVLVLERRAEDAPPSCCTGVVTRRTLAILGAPDRCVERGIHAVRVHFPGGRAISLRSQQEKAVVIDRRRLERELAQRTREAGAALHYHSEVVEAVKGSVTVRSGGCNETIEASLVVGADGPWSRVAGWFSLQRPRTFVLAAQVELEAPPHGDADSVDILLGRSVAPGFFAWSVPAQEGVVRVGVGVVPPHRPEPYLDRLLQRLYPDGRQLRRDVGMIPLERAPYPAGPGVLLVGDAAGHVKPHSGGGLYTGGLCARAAGEAAAHLARSPDLRRSVESTYAARCVEEIGREQAFGTSVRHHALQLKDSDADKLAEAMSDDVLLSALALHADIDMLHQLPDRLAADPRLWTSLLRLTPLLQPPMEASSVADTP
jgi:digeranylgeranylglycerophospholipid reductase